MIKLKPIAPKRRPFDPARQQQAIDAGLKDAAAEALKDFEATVKSWEQPATFTVKPQRDGITIATDNDVWSMLDKGTRPHTIVAHKIALRFPGGGYRAKTRPGFLGSQSGGGASGGEIFRHAIHHPGTKARGWSTLIKKKWQSRLSLLVQKRISEAVRR